MLNPSWKNVYKEDDFNKWDKVLQTSPPLIYPFQFNIIAELLEKYYRTNSGSYPNMDRRVDQQFKMLERTMEELNRAVAENEGQEEYAWHQRRDEEESLDAKLQREEDLREESSLIMKKRAKENFKGGLADGISDEKFDSKEIEMGIKVELEHTDSKDEAEEIAQDHLMENPKYYSLFTKFEKIMEDWDSDELEKHLDEMTKEATIKISSRDAEKDFINYWDKAKNKDFSKYWRQLKKKKKKKKAKASVPNPIRKNLDYGPNWIDRVKARRDRRKEEKSNDK